MTLNSVYTKIRTPSSFGEAAILQGGVRSAGARASGEVQCRRITAAEASELLLSHSPLLVVILEALLLQQSMHNALRNP
jgi:CRP-like cAMP-binding protein